MRRPTALFPLVFASLLVLAACNPSDEGDSGEGASEVQGDVAAEEIEGRLDVWGFGTDDVIGESRMAAFEEAYPNVDVKLTPGDFDNQKFLSAVASGDPPDVIYVSRDTLGSLAARGALLPLEDAIDEGGVDTGVFYDAAMEQVTFGDQIFGLPEFNNVVVAYLDDDVLQKAGVSPDEVNVGDWDQMEQLSSQISETNGNDVEIVGYDPKIPDFLPAWAAASGVELIEGDGTSTNFSDPALVEAVEHAQQVRETYGGQSAYSAFSQSWDIFGSENPLVRDQVGVMLFEQWYLSVLADASPDTSFTVKPFTMRGSDQPVTSISGNAWAIPEGADNADAAFAWMSFMTSTDTWLTAAEAAVQQAEQNGTPYTGTFTANQEADQRIFDEVYQPSGDEDFDQAVQVVLEVQDAAVALPANPAGAEIQQAYTDLVQQALLGEIAPQEALQRVDEEAEQALHQGG